jgi:hypothetical protein
MQANHIIVDSRGFSRGPKNFFGLSALNILSNVYLMLLCYTVQCTHIVQCTTTALEAAFLKPCMSAVVTYNPL